MEAPVIRSSMEMTRAIMRRLKPIIPPYALIAVWIPEPPGEQEHDGVQLQPAGDHGKGQKIFGETS